MVSQVTSRTFSSQTTPRKYVLTRTDGCAILLLPPKPKGTSYPIRGQLKITVPTPAVYPDSSLKIDQDHLRTHTSRS